MTLVEVLVALFIVGVTLAGIVSGYEYCLTSSVKDALYMTANAKAQQRLEQTRAAQWIVYGSSPIDQLAVTNFPDEVVVLDGYAQGTNQVNATLKTYITTISTVPPVRRVHVDCIWLFRGTEPVTNSIETERAPSQ
jgi:hypothetical protein